MKAVDFFKCLADETRLRCLLLLNGRPELCVCEITHALALSQPKISRHLALLRTQGLLQDRRKGAWVYYRLNPELPTWARTVLQNACPALADQPRFREDEIRLNGMPNRPRTKDCCAVGAELTPDYFSTVALKENPL